MTDRLKGLVVVFDQDIRVDDAEPIINAIKALRGVAAVDYSDTIVDTDDYMARQRVARDFGDKVHALYRELLIGKVEDGKR